MVRLNGVGLIAGDKLFGIFQSIHHFFIQSENKKFASKINEKSPL